MRALYIQVDAFHVTKIVVWHLHIYAFPETYQRFYRILRTKVASQDSTFRRRLWPVTASACFGGFDTQGNKGVHRISRRRRCPVSSLDNQFDRFQPLSQFCIISETNAKQGIAVLFRQTFGPSLTRSENQSRFHSNPPETIALCSRPDPDNPC